MNHGWIGAFAGLLLAGFSHAQPAPVGPASPSGMPPADLTAAPQTSELDAAAPWPEPAIPAYGAPSAVAEPAPGNVIPVSNPGIHQPPATVLPLPGGQIVEMPSAAPTWYDRLRAGRRRVAVPLSVPNSVPPALPPMTGAPLVLPESAGEQHIRVEMSAEGQLPPRPGEVPPSSGSPTEPLQQLPPPRPLDMAEPTMEGAPLPSGQWWFGVEYLMWFVARPNLPIPLLTTASTAPAVASSTTGALSNSTTLVLFDADGLRHGNYPGARLSTGFWFGPERIIGLEANAFFIQATEVELSVSGGNTSAGVLSRPFVNAATNTQAAAVVAFPITQTGSVSIAAVSQLHGGEFNLAAKFIRGVDADWDLIAGIRYLELEETLDVNHTILARTGNNLRFNGSPVTAGSQVTVFDRFDTRNRFTGAQLGVRRESRLGNMVLGCQLKVAAGTTRQTIDIDGGSTLKPPGAAAATFLPGGILALPSNIGQVVVNDFTVVPQLQFTVGYQCLENVRLWASYECLYWSNTVRPGDQIDPAINVTTAPTLKPAGAATGPERPLGPVEQRSLFMQGISVGMEMKF